MQAAAPVNVESATIPIGGWKMPGLLGSAAMTIDRNTGGI
jgi:hypothetical protein